MKRCGRRAAPKTSQNNLFFRGERLTPNRRKEKRIIGRLTRNENGFVCKDRSGKLEEYEKPDLTLVINKVFNKGKRVREKER